MQRRVVPHFVFCAKRCEPARMRGALLGARPAPWLGCAALLAAALTHVGGEPRAFGANTNPVVFAAANQVINEGEFLDMSFDGAAPALGLIHDPDSGDTHTATVNWGDGTGDQTANIFGSAPNKAISSAHTYADGGPTFSDYTTILTVSDGIGTPATDTLFVRVLNVSPTLGVTPSPTSIDEGQSVSFLATFSDPGFDNPLNTLDPANGGELVESFRYYLSWGDGLDTIATQDVADNNGGPGVASTGMFNGSHTYANDGAYTVTIRLADDDMGAYADAARFVTGVAGLDYVEQTFTVTVAPIPEPTALVLTMNGLACLVAPLCARQSRKAATANSRAAQAPGPM